MGMEHPWNSLTFRTDIFIGLRKDDIARKIRALRKYNSQSFKDYFEESYARACASTRGLSMGVEFAEAFECIRTIL